MEKPEMSDDKRNSYDHVDPSKFKVLMEKVEGLLWEQRSIPLTLINPCTQSYENIAKYMFDLQDDGKIKKVIIEHGDGKVLPFNSSVYLHYTCFLEEKKVPFDSSLFRSVSLKHYQMGGGYLFHGFEIALASMKANETSQFLIHPDYAFGKLGCPPRIPANAQVMVVIKVSGFIDCGYVTLSNKKGEKCGTFQDKLKIAKSHNALAIDYYKHGRIKMAFHHFREAQYTIDKEENTKNDECERLNLLEKFFINQLMCLSHPKYLKPKKLIEVATSAETKLPELSQKNAKFNCCLGIAHTNLQDYKAAAEFFKKAQTLSPFLPRLNRAVKYLQEHAGRALKQEKVMWQDAFNKMGYAPVPCTDEEESEENILIRKYANDVLTRCLKNEHFKCLNLGSGFTKNERQILKEESQKLGLNYQQYLEHCKIFVEVQKS